MEQQVTMHPTYLPSAGGGRIFCRVWTPDAPPKAVLQIAHGLSEHSGRYDELARYLAARGYAVVASDHMGHGRSDGAPGCFDGGWWAAVEDLRRLARHCHIRWPDAPLFLLGHSMGSFLARTLLIDHPTLPLTGALLSGTAQYPRRGTALVGRLSAAEAALRGERTVGGAVAMVNQLFNAPFAPNRSPWDWVSRDEEQTEARADDPLCDTPPALGLQRDLLRGVVYNQRAAHLARMNKALPVLFFSGASDPVGMMGYGVLAAAESFRRAGMRRITVKLYTNARHEMLHELGRAHVFADLDNWMQTQMDRRA